MIVEGDAEFRKALQTVTTGTLSTATVVVAANAPEGFIKVSRQKFDLVITDQGRDSAAGEDFIASLRRLKESQQPTYIMVASGAPDGTELQTVGRVTYLSKPFSTEKMVTFLRRAVKGEIVEEATGKAAAPKIDVGFINPFIQGTLSVLETMCGVKAERKEIYLRKNDHISGDISAVIAMNSPPHQGSMAISFEKNAFLEVVNKLMGEDNKEITAENQDTAAELCNQIFGFARTALNEKGYKIQSAIPSVITGKNHTIKHMVNGPCIAVKFAITSGHFTIEAAIQSG